MALTIDAAQKRVFELRQIIERNNRLYYEKDAPEIEDFEYDQLNRELKQLEAEFPQLITADSPTQKVGGAPSGRFAKVVHEIKMESLQDAFSYDELREFDRRVRETAEHPVYVVEAKIDGLSVSLEYVNGQFYRGSTRGDGMVGEDVTQNLATIKAIPKTLAGPSEQWPEFLEVRGEVYMPHDAFFKLVEEQELNDKQPFKNPRNAAAGSLRQKDSKITASRGLSIFVFNIQQIQGRQLERHSESLDYVKSMGFTVSPRYHSFDNIEAAIKEIAEMAGVSISTASIVLRGDAQKRKITEKTAQRVLNAAKHLGYTPNVSARRLRAPQTDSFVISIFWASLWAGEFRAPTLQFLRGVQSVLDTTEKKCEIMIYPYQRGHLSDNFSRLSLCHAAIVCNATSEDLAALENTLLPVPVVLHSRKSDVLPCVYIDYLHTGEIPAQIFHKQGMMHVLLCVPSSAFVGASDCERAFIRCALEMGMSVQRMVVDDNMAGGYRAAHEIAQMNPRPDCIFFLSDVLALGALKGFHESKIRIPEDLRIISLGSYDSDMEEYANPSLSVVRMPLEEMGAAALTKAIQLLSDFSGEQATQIPVSYIARESCPEE